MKKLTQTAILDYLKKRCISGVSCHIRGSSETWRVRVSVDGRLKTASLSIDEHDTLKDIERRVLQIKSTLMEGDSRPATVYLDQYALQKSLRPETKRSYSFALRGFVVNGSQNLARMAEMLQSDLADGSRVLYFSKIRKYFAWMRDQGYTTDQPDRAFELPRHTRHVRSRTFTDDEISFVRKQYASQPHKRLLFELALCTGARASTLQALTPQSLESGRLHLYNVKLARRYDVVIPIPKPVQKLWKNVVAENNPFPNAKSTTHHMGQDFRDWFGRNADGETLSFHSLRHTFATRALQSGVPLDVVSKLLDHSCLSTTLAVYARHSQAQIDEGVKKALASMPVM